MQKTLTIKEQNLHEIVKDLMEKALEIDRPNREKICQFVINMADNGGRKQKAAYDAGFGGSKKDENGNKRPEEDRQRAAAVEANRLLKDAKILAVYERLISHRLLSVVFARSLQREHIISVMYQVALSSWEKNPKQAITALKEAATLSGFYKDKSQGDDPELPGKKAELAEATSIIPKYFNANTQKQGTLVVVDKEKLN